MPQRVPRWASDSLQIARATRLDGKDIFSEGSGAFLRLSRVSRNYKTTAGHSAVSLFWGFQGSLEQNVLLRDPLLSTVQHVHVHAPTVARQVLSLGSAPSAPSALRLVPLILCTVGWCRTRSSTRHVTPRETRHSRRLPLQGSMFRSLPSAPLLPPKTPC